MEKFISLGNSEESKLIRTYQCYPQIFVRDVIGVRKENGFEISNQQLELLVHTGRLSFCKKTVKDAIDSGTVRKLPRSIVTYSKHLGISVRSGRGCHSKGTKVRMYDGSLKNVEDVQIGDLLMGDDSTPRTVLELKGGFGKMYRIKGRTIDYVVNEDHILVLRDVRNNLIKEISVREYLKLTAEEKDKLCGIRALLSANLITSECIDSVEYEPDDNYYGFLLDGNHRYLLEDFTITHNSGKTGCTSWIIFWFMCTQGDCKMPILGPNQKQLKNVLWKEMLYWYNRRDTETDEYLFSECFRKNIEMLATDVKYMNSDGECIGSVFQKVSPRNADVGTLEAVLSGEHHPNMLIGVDEACFDDNTEILTDEGWKLFENLTGREKVVGETGWEDILKIHSYDYSSNPKEIYVYDNIRFSMAVNGNHRVLWKNQKGLTSLTKMEDLYEKKHQSIRIPKLLKSEYFESFKDDYIDIPTIVGGKIYEGYKIKTDIFCEFLGWYYSEGSLSCDSRKFYRDVLITQSLEKNPKKCEIIRNMLKRLGLPFKEYLNKRRTISFKITSVPLTQYLLSFGHGCLVKRLPSWLFEVSLENKIKFIDAYTLGDGYLHCGRQVIYSSNEGLSNDVHRMILTSGRYGTLKRRKLYGMVNTINDPDGTTHTATSSRDGWVITCTDAGEGDFHISGINIKKQLYDRKVWCVTTESGLLYVRRRGKSYWSGNSSIPSAVFNSIDTTLTGRNNFMLMLFNPTRTSGYAFDTHFHSELSKHFIKLHWSTEDSSLVTKEYIEVLCNRYGGRDSNQFRVSVLGIPPTSDDNSLIPFIWVQDAKDRYIKKEGKAVIGVDIARSGGDSTVVCVRYGGYVEGFYKIVKIDTFDVVNEVMKIAKEKDAECICIDSTTVGAGIYDTIRRIFPKTYGVEFGRASRDIKFRNLRAELFYRVRGMFEKGMICLPDDENITVQLSTIRFTDENGKITIELKDKIRQRLGGSSPDYADSLAISMYVDDNIYRNSDKEIIDPYDLAFQQARQSMTKGSWMTV